MHCPAGAIVDASMVADVTNALADSSKVVFAQVAPSVRVALGELFGLPPGTAVTSKIFAALRKLGFDKVYDTLFAADLTIMEEANELIRRIREQRPLPQFTSCCPSWVYYAETHYPKILPYLSTAKSPHQMLGVVMKTYIAQKNEFNPANIFTVSVMPCTAKKYECQRSEMNASGFRDVDAVITTRELAQMIRKAGIDFNHLVDEEPDSVGGKWSGAAAIFGATGGVMEAALRTAYEIYTGDKLGPIDYTSLRGSNSVRDATVAFGNTAVKVAIVYGISNARSLVEEVLAENSKYHFIEVMNCFGGCVNGGGQPIYQEERKGD
jgi:iron-only hydrogenase group A